jgi:hypothetical protein
LFLRKIALSLFLFTLCSACAPNLPAPTVTPVPASTSTAIPTETPSPTVAPTAEPTSATSKPQTILIYLIAVGDQGASGELIGCGDSLVPVEVAIEPTVAVLRAALTALLNLAPNFTYGQSGLYNALDLSALKIDALDIVDRQAIIHLSGSLVSGRECDIPRIEAQLTATALQFSTIDSVIIYVNDILLQDLLDLRG